MVKKYDNEFKVMIVELLNSGIETKQVSEDYDLSLNNDWSLETRIQAQIWRLFKEEGVIY